MLALLAGRSGPISSMMLMNEHASKSSRRNQPSKASKMARSCSSGAQKDRSVYDQLGGSSDGN